METRVIKGQEITREKAVLDNMGLVRKVALKYKTKARKKGIEFEDLENIGAIGLIKAFDEFDEKRGLQFSTFAVYKILGEITRAVINGIENGVRYPCHLHEDVAKIKRDELENEPVEVIASLLGISNFRAKNAVDYLNTPGSLSLDSVYKVGAKKTDGLLLHEVHGKNEDFSSAIVNDFLSGLTDREQDMTKILLAGGKPKDVAAKWGNSRTLVGKVRQKVRGKYLSYMQK